MIEQMNKISSTFCAAKWRQVTIDLYHGLTHSCHHTKRLPIDLLAFEQDVDSIHNSVHTKHVRHQMLQGIRPKECDYCWKIEDSAITERSDRFIKSTDSWACFDKYDEILTNNWDKNIIPTYVEVMFSKKCNLSCLYCAASISSKIDAEIKKHGDYLLPYTDFRSEIIQELSIQERNSLKKRFLIWLEKILPQLHYLRVTGGEPLLEDELFKTISLITSAKLQDNFTFAINTNLMIDADKLQHLINRLKALSQAIHIELFISVDTFGKHAEFIRYGLRYRDLITNIKNLMDQLPNIKIILMTTFNILTFYKFTEFLYDVEKLKQKNSNVTLDISYLNNPIILSPLLATNSLLQKLHNYCKYMDNSSVFTIYEVQKLKRILDYCQSSEIDNKFALQTIFLKYIKEYASRYDITLNEYLPEIEAFKSEALLEYKRKLANI